MKLDQLRKIIREEVRAAVKEELQEVINEAVKIASTPESKTFKETQKPTRKLSAPKSGNTSLDEMLKMTADSMTNEEYRNVYTGTADMVQKPNFANTMANQMGMTGPQPGIDLSQLDFVKKAGAIFKESVKKDKQRVGAL